MHWSLLTVRLFKESLWSLTEYMGVQCFQASCFYWLVCHHFCLFHFHQYVRFQASFRALLTWYLALSKIIDFISHLLLKFWVVPFPATLNTTWKNTFLTQPPCYLLFAFISPRSSLSFFFVLGNSHHIAFSERNFPLLSVSAVCSASLTIFPALYFKVFPSFFLFISSFFTSLSEKKGITPLFLFSEISSSVCSFKLYPISCPLSW